MSAEPVPTSRAALWWGLARPSGFLWVPMLPLLGYGFAHWDLALDVRAPAAFVAVAVAWMALHAGTMWLNASLDRDQGAVLLGRPLPVPAGTDRVGLLALALAVALSAAAGPIAAACAAGAAALAVLYSHPRTAWKGHPLGGPLVNLVGYGVLSPLAGWSLVGAPVTARACASDAILAAAVLGAYFVAQAFQADEDRDRGYRTLVAVAGTRAVVAAGSASLAVAGAGVLLLGVAGWYPRPVLIALPAMLAVGGSLADLGRQPTETSARDALHRVLLAGWLVVVGAYGAYGWQILSGSDGPVAGLATAAGHAVDGHEVDGHDVDGHDVDGHDVEGRDVARETSP